MFWWIVASIAVCVVGYAVYALSKVSREDVDQYLIDSGNGHKVDERARRLKERNRNCKRP